MVLIDRSILRATTSAKSPKIYVFDRGSLCLTTTIINAPESDIQTNYVSVAYIRSRFFFFFLLFYYFFEGLRVINSIWLTCTVNPFSKLQLPLLFCFMGGTRVSDYGGRQFTQPFNVVAEFPDTCNLAKSCYCSDVTLLCICYL